MSYSLSRLMSAATASYAGLCFARPEHLGQALGADADEQSGYDRLALIFGVRDLSISTFGLLGRSERTITTAMWIRILCDVGDGVVLASRADDGQTRAKVLVTTMSWGTLNLAALQIDNLRARRAAALREAAAVAKSSASSVIHAVS